jgi:tRNA pseudouridine38-40 synthase
LPRYKLTIAYDGTDFFGWQKQEPPDPAGDPALGAERPRVKLRTVQEVVERAVREIVREPVEVKGASRTDSGVHARGQVAAFTCSDGGATAEVAGGGEGAGAADALQGDAPTADARHHGGWPVSRGTDRLLRAINSRLPDDCLITAVEPVALDFDPILGCTSKGYSYTLHYSPRHLRPLWDRHYVHEVHTRPDAPAMSAGAKHLLGEHDFAAFAAAGHNRQTTVRTIFSCEVTERTLDNGDLRIRIDIAGSGFLWNMVRIIAGTLLEVGRGHFAPEDVSRILDSRNRGLAGPTLPASGLCLEWIRY